jgi:hypothetical protein
MAGALSCTCRFGWRVMRESTRGNTDVGERGQDGRVLGVKGWAARLGVGAFEGEGYLQE